MSADNEQPDRSDLVATLIRSAGRREEPPPDAYPVVFAAAEATWRRKVARRRLWSYGVGIAATFVMLAVGAAFLRSVLTTSAARGRARRWHRWRSADTAERRGGLGAARRGSIAAVRGHAAADGPGRTCRPVARGRCFVARRDADRDRVADAGRGEPAARGGLRRHGSAGRKKALSSRRLPGTHATWARSSKCDSVPVHCD